MQEWLHVAASGAAHGNEPERYHILGALTFTWPVLRSRQAHVLTIAQVLMPLTCCKDTKALSLLLP